MNLLFVCVENSCRSQMAEAFARLLDEGDVTAHSAGSAPSGVVNPKAITAMEAIGYDLTKHRSKGLDQVPPLEYDAVVTMGCGDECPSVRAHRNEDWPVPQPRDMGPEEFAAVRDEVRDRVQDLIERIRRAART